MPANVYVDLKTGAISQQPGEGRVPATRETNTVSILQNDRLEELSIQSSSIEQHNLSKFIQTVALRYAENAMPQ